MFSSLLRTPGESVHFDDNLNKRSSLAPVQLLDFDISVRHELWTIKKKEMIKFEIETFVNCKDIDLPGCCAMTGGCIGCNGIGLGVYCGGGFDGYCGDGCGYPGIFVLCSIVLKFKFSESVVCYRNKWTTVTKCTLLQKVLTMILIFGNNCGFLSDFTSHISYRIAGRKRSVFLVVSNTNHFSLTYFS